jgi:hypothetical protein
MYRSLGNIRVNPRVGLLFVDFTAPDRMRVNGTATVSDADPLLQEFPGAVFIVRVVAERIFPNCPRYLHRMALTDYSEYAPEEGRDCPVPGWKSSDAFRDALPARDRTGGKKA